ncbi:MAG: hypothetical protein LBK61_14400 [Spirochaetaceae bacterium]|jgi:hypothetical protein|nr:hypothetical protein [Spirochaetaceae bacterium]
MGKGDENSEGGPSSPGESVDPFDPTIPGFYVSATENADENSGESEAEPFATLSKAYAEAVKKNPDSEIRRRRIVVRSNLTQPDVVAFGSAGDFITIEGRRTGYSIGRSTRTNGSVLEITGGAKIKFVNIKVNGVLSGNAVIYNRAIKVDGDGSEGTLGQGAVLTEKIVGSGAGLSPDGANINGSGVFVTNSGKLTLEEGEVTGCQGATSVGAVFANNGGSVSMSGGWIRGNVSHRGGGVALYQKAVFTMNGSGGIYAFGDRSNGNIRPALTLDGGKILDNNAPAGGGVYTEYELTAFTI